MQFASYLVIYGVYGGDKNAFSKLFVYSTMVYVVTGAGLNLLLRKMTPVVGKRKALIRFAAGSLLIPLVSLIAFDSNHPYLYFLFGMAIAVAATSIEILSYAILADVCDIDELKSGAERRRFRWRAERRLPGGDAAVADAGHARAGVFQL